MKKDITLRNDIECLVRRFYEKVVADPAIGYIFTKVVRVNWEKHLPVMFDFWENTLFYTGTYTGNLVKLHEGLHRVHPLKDTDFKQWVLLFVLTVDELFEGEKAELAKQRAISIATIMRIKIVHANDPDIS